MKSNYSAEIELDLSTIHEAALLIEADCKPRHESTWRRTLRQQKCLKTSQVILESLANIREWLKRDNRQATAHTLRIDGKHA